MSQMITIREAIAPQEVEAFWKALRSYQIRDLFPDPEDAEREYFLDDNSYRAAVETLHEREKDRCYYLFFSREGQDIGFALPVIYRSEDGKCLIMEFCVFPEFRGQGIGSCCGEALLNWAREHGALYAELNYGRSEDRYRFWNRLGFLPNGCDEWGEPLLMLPPKDEVPVTVERLLDPEDWQLLKLENGFLAEIGEAELSEEKTKRLQKAVNEDRITFFLAKRGYRSVGMCSVVTAFSTFSCGEVGVFDDFYIEPVFRGKGIARLLANAVQEWCSQQGLASLTVSCAPCDEEMYRALGFELRLGVTCAYVK